MTEQHRRALFVILDLNVAHRETPSSLRAPIRLGVVGVAIVWGVGACEPATPKLPTKPPCAHEPCVSVTKTMRRARIEYEVAGRSFQLPVVRGSVGGVPTLFLVDSGANTHAITRWLAKKAKLPLENRGDSSTDHAGKPVTSMRTSRPALRIDGWGPLPDQETLVIDVPEALEKLGIGGFVSPQRLDSETVVLDLLRGEIRESESLDHEKGVLAEWASFSRPEPRSLPEPIACKDDSTPIGALSFVVPATVDDQKVMLLVDTGAQRTDIFGTSTAGKSLLPRAEPGEALLLASGKIETKLLRNTELSVGDVHLRLDMGLLPGTADTVCPRDGVLAMDVLRRCVLVLSKGTLHGRCISASQPEPPAPPP